MVLSVLLALRGGGRRTHMYSKQCFAVRSAMRDTIGTVGLGV